MTGAVPRAQQADAHNAAGRGPAGASLLERGGGPRPSLAAGGIPDAVPVPPRTLRGTLGAFWELGKPRLSMLNIVAVLAGAWLPYSADILEGGPGPDRVQVWGACIGAFLAAIAANAVNMWIERDLDRRMQRTVSRPLPSGRLSPRAVLTYGIVCVVLGLALMAATTNALATGLCALVFVLYTAVYTPLKRHTSLNTIVGAIPGALPPLVGYAATMGGIGLDALLVFLLVFFWQIPHFLAIAWRYRRDYAAAGMIMLPALDPTGARTGRQMLAWVAGLTAVSVLPFTMQVRGEVFLACTVLLNILFLAPAIWAAVSRSEEAMRATFRMSLIYLPGMLAAWVFSPGYGV